ncbi:MAG: hypothetical protein OXT67_02380 [Zetaproteobacteria bacterium]|nr:hypothetical protein [Zetaproteobacteria bacterium]
MRLAALIIVMSVGSQLLGEGIVPSGNIRSRCRQRFAGHYMSLYDQAHGGQKKYQDLQRKMKQIKQEVHRLQQKLLVISEQIYSRPLDADLQMQRDSVTYAMLRFEQAQRQMKHTSQLIRKNIREAHRQIAMLNLKMQGIFILTKILEDHGGWGYKIVYAKKCGVYDGTCPLSAQDAQKLLGLHSVDFELPRACRLYAHYLQEDTKYFYGRTYR